MPSTHVNLHYHLIYSTKDRLPQIRKEWRDRLHAFLGGAVRTCGGTAVQVGGIEDHVHLLVGLKASHCLADVLREIKSSSSKWVHKAIGKPTFSWQEGYAAFTVSPSQINKVKRYIERQEEHHRKMDFKEEYRKFLEQSGVEFDERYLW